VATWRSNWARDSHNLVAVDLDHDHHVEPFLRVNPAFRNTLRTRGSKGAQFWFYATDDYPQEVRRLEINGSTENAGEFRGRKCISIIWGVHENGNLYSRVNDVPPIQFAYRDIICPAGWRVIEPKNNFKLGGNGNQNTGPPTPTGRRGNPRVDWDRFNEALRNKTTTGFDRYNVWYVKSKEKFLWCGPDNTWITFVNRTPRLAAFRDANGTQRRISTGQLTGKERSRSQSNTK
jgi:hypothetical protein